MTTRVLRSLEELEGFQSAWLALWESCPAATPFQSPQWLLPWTRDLFGGGAICSLALYEADLATGFAPLFRWGTGLATISFLGAGISDYGGVLFAPGREAVCVAAVCAYVAEQGCQLDLREIPSHSKLLQAFSHEECSICPVLSLDTFPDSMDSKHRTDVRRARNKLCKEPDVRLSFATEATP